jgi:hypothetical protein
MFTTVLAPTLCIMNFCSFIDGVVVVVLIARNVSKAAVVDGDDAGVPKAGVRHVSQANAEDN